MGEDRHVVVLGGGITGLAAAHALADRAGAPRVTLVEASSRLGGKIRTEELAGLTVEAGADAFLAREPEILELTERLGLAGELVAPDVTEAWICHAGRLHPLPEGLVLGVPTRLGPLWRSDLVPTSAVFRAALDRVLPREVDVDHESVAELVEHRVGRVILDRLVDPLLSGVYAGDVAELSASAATPRLAAGARSGRSLMRELRRAPAGEGERVPFRTLPGGLDRLVQALAAAPGVDIRLADPARLVDVTDAGYGVQLASGARLDAHAIVLAVPAYVGAALLRDVVPEAADPLRDIPYASVAVVALVYDGRFDLPGSGMLVPRSDERVVKAATWVTNKWACLHPDGRTVIRASIGRAGDDATLRLDDGALIGAVHEELRDVVDLPPHPAEARVTRWERSMPQYVVGHEERVARVRGALAGHPGLVVAGAAYEGVGIAACVRQGVAAAEAVVSQLSDGPWRPVAPAR